MARFHQKQYRMVSKHLRPTQMTLNLGRIGFVFAPPTLCSLPDPKRDRRETHDTIVVTGVLSSRAAGVRNRTFTAIPNGSTLGRIEQKNAQLNEDCYLLMNRPDCGAGGDAAVADGKARTDTACR